jgi:hypothetical protein
MEDIVAVVNPVDVETLLLVVTYRYLALVTMEAMQTIWLLQQKQSQLSLMSYQLQKLHL